MDVIIYMCVCYNSRYDYKHGRSQHEILHTPKSRIEICLKYAFLDKKSHTIVLLVNY